MMAFWWLLYKSIGDHLPDRGSLAFKISEVEDCEDALRVATASIASASQISSVMEILKEGPGTFRGQRRYVPSEPLTQYWHQFRSLSGVMGWTDVSLSTFSRCADFLFKKQKVLGFRGPGEHAKCTACEGYKLELREAISCQVRKSIFEVYTRHLLDQWLDRQRYAFRSLSDRNCVETICDHLVQFINIPVGVPCVWDRLRLRKAHWQARSFSIQTANSFVAHSPTPGARNLASSCQPSPGWHFEPSSAGPCGTLRSLLTIAADGMDQAKYRVPRFKSHNHLTEHVPRVALHVHAAWAHGFGLHFAATTPQIPKDAQTNLEVICRLLDIVFAAAGGTLPEELWLQLDNTGRENKNQRVFRWCIYSRHGYPPNPSQAACTSSSSMWCGL